MFPRVWFLCHQQTARSTLIGIPRSYLRRHTSSACERALAVAMATVVERRDAQSA